MTQAHNRNNIDAMREIADNFFDLAIIDPQTGQGEGKNHTSRPYSVKQKNGDRIRMERPHKISNWDDEPPQQEFYDELFRVSRHQIIMCENYLTFDQKKDSAGRIVWNLLRDNDFSSCQIMWTDLFQKIEYFEYLWNGMIQGDGINSRRQFGNKTMNEKRIHPSQKPVIVYRYLLKTYAKPGWKILDTMLGSGSSRIAAEIEGFDFWGYELDDLIFTDQEKRFRQFKQQLTIR